MKLAKPKSGKFAPSCSGCKKKFQLLIKEQPDGSFKYKTAPFKANPSKPSPTAKPAQSKRTPVELNATRAESSGQTRIPDGPATASDINQTRADSVRPSQAPTQTGPAAGANVSRTASAPAKKGRLGPYRLIKILGEGGMGSVYLANQTSLDREVALKVVKNHLSANPAMLARFTREAYAAAQLVHPNVVQIYDMGDDNGNSYFSMELVDGCSLHQLIGEKKKLDPEEAASYILHAARGLQCAHNAGMVHRDVKPGNLLVNQDGLVKVADLGLVQVPNQDEIDDSDVNQMVALSASKDLTRVGATIGTPYYMAPEQAKTAAVDHRADIYSLGCTFYVLLTGKRPFDGKSIEEVVSKHTNEPLIVPSQIVERVPGELSSIVAKMMAKRAADRYQSMGELIEELENFLGVKSSEAFTPDEKDAIAIETACKTFNSPATAKLRGVMPLALLAVSILFAFVTSFISWRLATGFLLMPFFAFAAYFVTSGLNTESVLFNKARELVYRGGVFVWLKWAFAAILLVAASFLVGTFPHWLFVGVLGVGLGAGYYFLIDLATAKARVPCLASAETLVRRMRVKGMEESTIQNFVAKYSPPNWEEFFEKLFGYEAKRRVRDQLATSNVGKQKKKFRAWRDGIFDRFSERLEAFTNDDDRKHLRQVEEAGLVATGVSAQDARGQASQMADAIVDNGDAIRIAQLEKRLAKADPKFEREQQREKIKAMLADARSGKYKRQESSMNRLSAKLDRFLGAYPRFLLGCCLIVGSLLWARQNDLLLSVDQLKELGEQGLAAAQDPDAANDAVESAKAQGQKMKDELSAKQTSSLWGLFHSFDSLIAGVVLLLSTIVFGWRMSIFVIPAAIVAMFGSSFGIPDFLPAAYQVPYLNTTTALIAIGLFCAGVVFGRREE